MSIAATRESTPRLPGCACPTAIRVHADPKIDADIALIAVPTQSSARCCQPVRPARRSSSPAPRASTCHRPRAHGPDPAPRARGAVAQLTGPSFAVDIAAHLPTALTLACADDAAGALQAALSTPVLRLYRTTDVVGAELGGALKNVVAIAAGAAIGAGLGDSARAAIIARGFAEMSRVATARGRDAETLTGLSGLGDLVLTCGSEKSRNFRLRRVAGDRCRDRPSADRRGSPYRAPHRRRHDARHPIADAVAAMADGRSTSRRARYPAVSSPETGVRPCATGCSNRNPPPGPGTSRWQKGDAGEEWDGVRNYQARNFMREMAVGDLGFFYHSQSEKAVVGIVEVIAEAHPDSTTDDDRWECVDIKAVEAMPNPVTLDQIKAREDLADMVLVKNSRLSVQPVTPEEWRINPPDGRSLASASARKKGGPRAGTLHHPHGTRVCSNVGPAILAGRAKWRTPIALAVQRSSALDLGMPSSPAPKWKRPAFRAFCSSRTAVSGVDAFLAEMLDEHVVDDGAVLVALGLAIGLDHACRWRCRDRGCR
jgi:glycerol-3-phosphate dehydrogenase (NAD(P)+)